jgi:hypothetical protein
VQIIINTETDKPGAIANMAKFLLLGFGASADVAALVKAQVMQVPSPTDTKEEAGKTSTNSTQVVPNVPSVPTIPVAPAVPAADPQAAAVFGGATAPVPVAPTQIPSVPGVPADVVRDSAGVPWDARIHAGTQTTKQDGTWKLKKGVDAGVVTTVLAEIGAVKAADAAPLVPAAPATAPQIPAVPGVPAAAIPPAVPSTASPTPAPATSVTFRGTMAKMNAAVAAGKFAKGDVDAMLTSLGIAPDAIAKLVLPAESTNLQAFDALLTAGGA